VQKSRLDRTALSSMNPPEYQGELFELDGPH
jgi:hypothetical protein